MSEPLPLVVVGGGWIGVRHAHVANQSDKIELLGIVEPNETQANMLREEGFQVYQSIEDAPKATEAAIIATPTPTHTDIALDALEQNWSLIVEKPISDTLYNAHLIMKAARTPVFIGHHRRCHGFTIEAKKRLSYLGDIVAVQGLWSLRKHESYYNIEWRQKPGAGPLMTNMSHEFDLLHFLLGSIHEITALTSNATRQYEVEDTASLAFSFTNGALGSFLISEAGASPWAFEAASGENPYLAASNEDYLRIIGTEGALAFPSLTSWGASQEGEIEWRKPLHRVGGMHFPKVDPLLVQIERFSDALNGKQDTVLCRAEDGIKALEATLATVLSAKTGKPVRCNTVPHNFGGL